MQRSERFDCAERIIRVGFWVTALLMVFKLSAGYWGHSGAVFADGIESACDFVAIFASLIALKLGRQPFDSKHPYGHGRAENLSALVISLVIFATGIWILVDSIHAVTEHNFKAPGLVAVCAALITILVKEWLFRYTRSTGNRLESPTLLAIAQDHRKDALSSIATLVGVGGAFAGVGIMDPLAAGLTSLFILHVGYATFKTAAHDLMDGTVSPNIITMITQLAEATEGVEHVHEIRGRRSGQYVIIDLKLDMDPNMTVKRSHDIARGVKQKIFKEFSNVGDVMIHINPHDEEHEDLTRL